MILVCLFVFGYSLFGLASMILPSAPAAERARLPDTDTKVSPAGEDGDSTSQKEETRKPSSSAATCDDVRVLVDRSHKLPPDYAPGDLISLPAYGVPTLGGREMLLRREAAEHLRSLMTAAAADGEELVVASAFRSYAEQQSSHARLRSIYGFVLAYPPGHDGTVYDFEPWHYRYIGVENAGRLEQSGLTPQEFLVREGVTPHC